jgi:hypothetical protein
VDPTELWKRWYDTGSKMWSDLSGGDGETFMDPYGLYQRWFENLENTRQQIEAGSTTAANPQEIWQRWAEANTETWREAAGIGMSAMRQAPRWLEMGEGVQKQMLEDGLPTDPMDFFLSWYNATSEPLSNMADDILKDEEFLEASRRFFENYASFYKVFSRASEEYFSIIQLSTSSDIARVAGLVIALEDKIDRVEEAFEDFEYGYTEPATAEAVGSLGERLERVESRLDQLDRVESKLDQLLGARDTENDGRGEGES